MDKNFIIDQNMINYIFSHTNNLHKVQKKLLKYNEKLGHIKKLQISILQANFIQFIIKINNYKSLHTAIIGPNKRPIEIQLRTQQMHEFAQRGIASHWKYKSSEKFNSLTWKEYDWLADLVEIMDKNENPEDSFEYTKLQMFQDNVFCFTPKGSVIKLPKNASPIDFAYAVHTKVGDSATGCEINGKESPLQSELMNGDVVKIITSKKASPSLHWLTSTKTGKARAAIRRLLAVPRK